MPDTIMIFAAGRGTRLGRLTQDRPKPLVPVLDRTMLDRALDIADRAGVSRKIVNTHYLGSLIEAHLRARRDVRIVPESPNALETGGGLKNANRYLGDGPVFTLNPDVLWSGPNPLEVLRAAWRPAQMGALLLLIPLARATAHKGRGDFSYGDAGRLMRFDGTRGAARINTGAQIIWPTLAQDIEENIFSLNIIWDELIKEGRLFGVEYPGTWVDTGTPEGIKAAETLLTDTTHV